MFKILLLICLAGFVLQARGQDPVSQRPSRHSISRKGNLFYYFGWNRSNYSTSDIHFRGADYNFTLSKVVAHDRPTAFDPLVYFNPLKLSYPQYQYRVGYYLTDKYAISWGFNHMKYVMDAYQTVKITGAINSPLAGKYNGIYTNQDIVLDKDFLQFEHTNGLNYVNFNFGRTETLWVAKNKVANISAVFGVGAGLMYPKSDIKIFNNGLDRWHIAGYGLSTYLAFRFDFLKHMFIQAQWEGGYINMPDILTTGIDHARARQHFRYMEETIMIGGYRSIHGRKKK